MIDIVNPMGRSTATQIPAQETLDARRRDPDNPERQPLPELTLFGMTRSLAAEVQYATAKRKTPGTIDDLICYRSTGIRPVSP